MPIINLRPARHDDELFIAIRPPQFLEVIMPTLGIFSDVVHELPMRCDGLSLDWAMRDSDGTPVTIDLKGERPRAAWEILGFPAPNIRASPRWAYAAYISRPIVIFLLQKMVCGTSDNSMYELLRLNGSKPSGTRY